MANKLPLNSLALWPMYGYNPRLWQRQLLFFTEHLRALRVLAVWGYELVLIEIFKNLYFCEGKIILLEIKIYFLLSYNLCPSLCFSLSLSPVPLFSPPPLLLKVLAS